MLKQLNDASKFLDKLAADPGHQLAKITAEGALLFEGSRPVSVSDFVVVHEGILWGRSGMTWLSSAQLPEESIDLCAFSLKRFALFKKDSQVDISSEKKVLDAGSRFLLCAKLPSKTILLIADGEVCPELLRITTARDHHGQILAQVLAREFVRKVLPSQLAALDTFFNGGKAE